MLFTTPMNLDTIKKTDDYLQEGPQQKIRPHIPKDNTLKWSKNQQNLHKKQLKLMAINFAFLKFSKSLEMSAIIEQDNELCAKNGRDGVSNIKGSIKR